MSPPNPTRLFRQRNFRLLWIGETVSGAGSSMAAVGVPLAAVTVLRASTFVVSALCLLRIRATVPSGQSKQRADGVRTGGVRTEAWRGICFVARDPYLRPLTIYAAIANLAYTGNLALVVIFLVRVVGLSSAAVGLMMATGGIGGVFGALAAPRLIRACGTARALVLTVMGTGLSGLFIPLTARGPRLACYVTGSVLIAGGLVVANVIAASFRQEYSPPAMLGRVTASTRFLAFGVIPLGALLAGALGTALGIRNGLWVVLVIFAASSLFLLTPRIRIARNLPPAPARTGRKSVPTSSLRCPECLSYPLESN